MPSLLPSCSCVSCFKVTGAQWHFVCCQRCGTNGPDPFQGFLSQLAATPCLPPTPPPAPASSDPLSVLWAPVLIVAINGILKMCPLCLACLALPNAPEVHLRVRDLFCSAAEQTKRGPHCLPVWPRLLPGRSSQRSLGAELLLAFLHCQHAEAAILTNRSEGWSDSTARRALAYTWPAPASHRVPRTLSGVILECR